VSPSIRRWASGALTSVALVAAVTSVIAAITTLSPRLPAAGLGVLYLIAVVPVAYLYGGAASAAVAVASMAAFDFFLLGPHQSLDAGSVEQWELLLAFLLVSLLVGQLTARSQREARRSARLAEEQAALRRVATLVARGSPTEELFAAVIDGVGRVFPVDNMGMARFDPDDMMTTVAISRGLEGRFPVGGRWPLGGTNVSTIVAQTGRSARIDDYADASGQLGVAMREGGLRSSVGAPIVVEGRLWGVLTATSMDRQLPTDTEARLASFTELMATAIANAEGRAALAASRARVVAASDETRKRIERDLHDGTQQRLVALGFALTAMRSTVPSQLTELDGELSRVADELLSVAAELREISRGIHPAILSEGGLRPALRALCRRSALSVELDLHVDRRLPEPVEVAAYYVVSEALTNAAKHARSSIVNVDLDAHATALKLAIRDDGIGGADPVHGSGLVGLRDRVEAVGGTFEVTSPAGDGTTLVVHVPLVGRDGASEAPPEAEA
jgi:signal transduction histidine kinase